jgi:hypothetical protein
MFAENPTASMQSIGMIRAAIFSKVDGAVA